MKSLKEKFGRSVVGNVTLSKKKVSKMNSNEYEQLIDGMTWMLGYIQKIPEYLLDAIENGDLTYSIAHQIANRMDTYFEFEGEESIALMLEREYQ